MHFIIIFFFFFVKTVVKEKKKKNNKSVSWFVFFGALNEKKILYNFKILYKSISNKISQKSTFLLK